VKLSARDLPGFVRSPDTTKAGLLIYGQDAMRVALRRQDIVKALVGETGEEEMRLTRLAASDVRKDPALVSDEVKATGFFPGQRVVLVEDAQDGTTPAISAALEGWQDGDAMLVVTAGQLAARSKLRKLFEDGKNLIAIAIYTDPMSRDEVEAALKAAGLALPDGPVMQDLVTLGRALDPGDFRQTVEKLALYKVSDETPLSAADIAACAPATMEVAVDDVVNLAAEGQVDALCAALPQLVAQGANPTSLCIAATRHFRTLHAASCNAQGAEQGLSRARPPVFGPRRDRMARQIRHWCSAKLEGLLRIIMETDLSLRSSQPGPAHALVERMFIRIAMLHGR